MWNEFIEMDEAKQAKFIDKIEREVNEKSKATEPGPSNKIFGKQTKRAFLFHLYSTNIQI